MPLGWVPHWLVRWPHWIKTDIAARRVFAHPSGPSTEDQPFAATETVAICRRIAALAGRPSFGAKSERRTQ